jgi:hypothetical protein
MEAEEQQQLEAAPAQEQTAAAEDTSSNDATQDSTSSKDEQGDSNAAGGSSSKGQKETKIKAADAYANMVNDNWKSFAAGGCQVLPTDVHMNVPATAIFTQQLPQLRPL